MAPGKVVGVDRHKPASCAAVENFMKARHRDEHKRKISAARSIISNGWSCREENRLQASRARVKNDQLQDDRFNAIEKENMRLLVRMQEIDRREDDRRGASNLKAAARIVLGAPAASGPTRSMTRGTSLPAMGRGSNIDSRMKEMRRIDAENQRLLKRLQGTKATVANKKFEEQHQAQQHVMRMRQEHGPKVHASRCPLPFDPVPLDPAYDPESERLQNLHDELQRRVEELAREDGTFEAAGSQPATPRSARSAASNPACADAAGGDHAAGNDGCEIARDYIGGQMPEHSRAMVEEMMKEFEAHREARDEEARAGGAAQAEHDGDCDDKDAVAKMLAAAEALEPNDLQPHIGGGADYLSYDSVVQRSRAALRVSTQMMVDKQFREGPVSRLSALEAC